MGDMIREDSSDIERIYEIPNAEVDPLVWQYEHLRQFIMELNILLVALGDECTPETCPKMNGNTSVLRIGSRRTAPPSITWHTHSMAPRHCSRMPGTSPRGAHFHRATLNTFNQWRDDCIASLLTFIITTGRCSL